MPDHYYVSIIFSIASLFFWYSNCQTSKLFAAETLLKFYGTQKSNAFQSWLIIKHPNIYIIKHSALFVVHAFQLRNTKCFTNRTQFIIVPLLGVVPHDCLFYFQDFPEGEKRGKLLKSNAYNVFLHNLLEDLCKQFFTNLFQLLMR